MMYKIYVKFISYYLDNLMFNRRFHYKLVPLVADPPNAITPSVKINIFGIHHFMLS